MEVEVAAAVLSYQRLESAPCLRTKAELAVTTLAAQIASMPQASLHAEAVLVTAAALAIPALCGCATCEAYEGCAGCTCHGAKCCEGAWAMLALGRSHCVTRWSVV